MKTTAGCFTLGLLLMVSPGGNEGRGRLSLGTGALVAKQRVSFFSSGLPGRPKAVPAISSSVRAEAGRSRGAEAVVSTAPAVDMVGRLKDIFSSEGVPPELVWLAEVESAFDPHARSAAGAMGLFQFMPATARRFGLTVARDYDERLDPAKSTRAAARYLRFLYSEFGSWPLAVAAYNAGEGRVSRVLVRERAWTFDQVKAHLPSQTQQYVPRVMNIISWEEGLRSDQIAPPKT